jgi:hypothetical protein
MRNLTNEKKRLGEWSTQIVQRWRGEIEYVHYLGVSR